MVKKRKHVNYLCYEFIWMGRLVSEWPVLVGLYGNVRAYVKFNLFYLFWVGVFLFRILFASRTHVLLSTCVNSIDICMHISYTLFACIFNNSSAALFQYLYVRICVIHFNISFVFSGFELWHFYALVMYLERTVHKLLPICMSHTLCFSIDFFFVRFYFVILVFWSLARFLFRFALLSAPQTPSNHFVEFTIFTIQCMLHKYN